MVHVTAFPSRLVLPRYVADIALETEIRVNEASFHLKKFNGARFLRPYASGRMGG
jgi:hypothetical protein